MILPAHHTLYLEFASLAHHPHGVQVGGRHRCGYNSTLTKHLQRDVACQLRLRAVGQCVGLDHCSQGQLPTLLGARLSCAIKEVKLKSTLEVTSVH